MITDTTVSNENLDEDVVPSELDILKDRATLLGVKFHPSIGLEKLKLAVANALQEEPEAPQDVNIKSTGETPDQVRTRHMNAANTLVRVRVACMNPAKKEWAGELFTVSNDAVGTFKKFIPFNNDVGFHVPTMILDVMRERQCQIFVTEIGKDGAKLRKGKLIREFNIEELPQLTLKELEELAQRQAMNQSIDR